MRFAPVLALLALSSLAVGCTTTPTEPDGPYTVSGSIQTRHGAVIPRGARVVAVWDVRTGPEESAVVYGEGTVNPINRTFTITFPAAPPIEALNNGKLGVGMLILTTNGALRSGQRYTRATFPLLAEGMTGLAEREGVIFVGPDPDSLDVLVPWTSRFGYGYNVGRGVHVDNGLDTFVPVRPNDVTIIVDDPERLEFVGWS